VPRLCSADIIARIERQEGRPSRGVNAERSVGAQRCGSL
jgi:hypothetical protein